MEQFNSLNDVELTDLILKGDTRLYELIVRRYNPNLYKIGRSYNYTHHDTQDIMQETYLDVFKNLATFEGRSSFKTWIMRIMLNNCHRRREKFSFIFETAADIEDSANPMFAQSCQETEHIVRRREQGRIIEDSLANIPLDYRLIFSLREINGLNVAESAELLAISEANVKVRLNRAKELLRKDITRQYEVHELYEFNLIYCNFIAERIMNTLLATA